MRAITLLSLVARVSPAVWDVIIPHGPAMRSRGVERLNPQPLPPNEEFLAGAADMAHELVRLAVEADVRGDRSPDFLAEIIDDWCATPWPRKWPLPWPGPGPEEGPSPDPWIVDTGRVVGAVVFADAASRLAEGDLKATLARGAERLAEVAAQGPPVPTPRVAPEAPVASSPEPARSTAT